MVSTVWYTFFFLIFLPYKTCTFVNRLIWLWTPFKLISKFLAPEKKLEGVHTVAVVTCSVVAKKLGCRLKIKFRRLKEELNCPLSFTDSSPAKNPAGNLRFFSRWILPAAGT